jgi:ribosome-associated translation inhibitor RaiA
VKLLVIGEKSSVSEGLHDFITRRLCFVLGRFGPEIERVTVRVGDLNGPRGGGADKRCHLEVKLRGLGDVLGEACAGDYEAAVAFAAERLGRGVGRALERRNHKKRRPGVSMAGPRESAENGKRRNQQNPDAPASEPEKA